MEACILTRALVLAVAAGGCLAVPDHAGTMYACDKDPRCPDGFACVAGVCTQDVGADPGMVAIPGGTFRMGCQNGMLDCASDAQPAHDVTLSAFAIDQSEVSQAAYMECVAAAACTPGTLDGDAALPVRHINWVDAGTYCRFRGHRLPTEAEWERAARMADQPFPWGSAPSPPDCAHAIAAGCAGPVAVDAPSQGDASGGIHHMLGNVREWVDDGYDAAFYATAQAATNPDSPGTDPNQKVVRGGGFATAPDQLAVWKREHADRVQGYGDVGFRCAR